MERGECSVFNLRFQTLSTPASFVLCTSDKHYEYIKLICVACSTATIMLQLRLKTLQLFLVPSLITVSPFSASECMHHLSAPKYFQQNPKQHPLILFHQSEQLH